MLEFLWKTCTHEKITPNMQSGYCPDCGEYVKNHWYISRCECCGLKLKSIIRNGKVVALSKFCKNCGSNAFEVEELKNIDVVSINYAVVQKVSEKSKNQSILQTWIEQSVPTPMKLLPSF